MEKMRQDLSPQDLATFREQSAAFMGGSLSASKLHTRVAALGVAVDVPQLAALCPDASKRDELLQAHR